MSETIQGGCACGAVRYEITGDPVFSFNCHCKACQKATGCGYLPGMGFSKDNFELLEGEIKDYTVTADSGGTVSRGFCPECGAGVRAIFSSMPDVVGVAAGSLDDPSFHKPMMDIYTSHANAWDHMDPDLPKSPEAPPSK